MMDSDAPFYLGVNRNENAKTWFKGQPMGETKLNSLMKNAIQKTNIDKNKKITNHSGRKTTINRLLDEGVALTSVQQHSGHKSIASLYNYSKNSLKKQKSISDILNRTTTSDTSQHTEPSIPSTSNTTTTNAAGRDDTKSPCAPQIQNTNGVRDEACALPNPSGVNFADIFPRGTVIQGGTFNFNINMGKENVPMPLPPKRIKRKFVIDSDSE